MSKQKKLFNQVKNSLIKCNLLYILVIILIQSNIALAVCNSYQYQLAVNKVDESARKDCQIGVKANDQLLLNHPFCKEGVNSNNYNKINIRSFTQNANKICQSVNSVYSECKETYYGINMSWIDYIANTSSCSKMPLPATDTICLQTHPDCHSVGYYPTQRVSCVEVGQTSNSTFEIYFHLNKTIALINSDIISVEHSFTKRFLGFRLLSSAITSMGAFNFAGLDTSYHQFQLEINLDQSLKNGTYVLSDTNMINSKINKRFGSFSCNL